MDSGLLKLILAVLLCLPVLVACSYIFVRVCKDDKEADYSVIDLPRKVVRTKKINSEEAQLMRDMSAFDDVFFKQNE